MPVVHRGGSGPRSPRRFYLPHTEDHPRIRTLRRCDREGQRRREPPDDELERELLLDEDEFERELLLDELEREGLL